MTKEELKTKYWLIISTLLDDKDYLTKYKTTEKQKLLLSELDVIEKQLSFK